MAVPKEKQRNADPYLCGSSGGLTIQYRSVGSQPSPGSKSSPVPSHWLFSQLIWNGHGEKAGVKSCECKMQKGVE